METLSYAAANLAWLASGWPASHRFRRALHSPRQAQKRALRELLRRNADSRYGRRHGFARIRSVVEFQETVPVVTYEDLVPEIDAIRRGREQVLTTEPVLMLEKTSGSAGPAKYIPYTASLKREFGAAVSAWMADISGHFPGVLLGGAYWSVSPLATEPERTEGGLPVGFQEDTEYFSGLTRALLSVLIRTPPELPRVPDVETSRYVTLRFLLRSPHLGFISVWSPSFLTLLLDALDRHAGGLIEDVERGSLRPPGELPAALGERLERRLRPEPRRAAELRRVLRSRGALPAEEVWPALRVVSCWADASAAAQVPELQRRLPTVAIQPKGLLATEGVVSIPLAGHPGAAPALTSHFLEFQDPERSGERPRRVDELEAGQTYAVLLTTGGGLYRYALGDLVRVVGRVADTPLVELMGRGAQTSDLCGEKLHETWVREALATACREVGANPRFAMLVPEPGPLPRYRLVLELDGPGEALAGALERELRRGPHYDYCRRLGQLEAVAALPVREGWSAYLERCAALGQRRGSVKPVALHPDSRWREWLDKWSGREEAACG